MNSGARRRTLHRCWECPERIRMVEQKQPSASLATMSNKKKKKGGDEEGGGDASKNAWYIKILDAPPGLLYVRWCKVGVGGDGEINF